MGSNVPVWPMRLSRVNPRTTATASNDVKSCGLSKTMMPSMLPPYYQPASSTNL